MSKHPNAHLITSRSEVKDKLLPVLVGGDILTYSYVREFNRAYGIDTCIVLATQDIKMLSSSKFTDYRLTPGLYEGDTLYTTLESIAEEFRDAKTLILLGSDDIHARKFTKEKARLEKAGFVVPYIDFDLLDDITQKRRFHDICEELGIAVPETRYFDCSDHDAKMDGRDFTYPLIIKPSNSAKYQAADIPHKKKIYEVSDAEDFNRIISYAVESAYDDELIIQDFIPGGDEYIHTLTLFADENGITRVGAGGTVCVQDHDPTALGNPLCIMGEKVDEIYESGTRFLEHVGYHGFANFDIKYDERDDTYRFFEVNTRCGRNTYYMSLGGVNFTTLFVEDFILGNEIPVQYAGNDFLYCCVPRKVIAKSMPEGALKEKALSLFSKTSGKYPLDYSPDSFTHNLWAKIMWTNQTRKFKRFYWDTDGKQLDV